MQITSQGTNIVRNLHKKQNHKELPLEKWTSTLTTSPPFCLNGQREWNLSRQLFNPKKSPPHPKWPDQYHFQKDSYPLKVENTSLQKHHTQDSPTWKITRERSSTNPTQPSLKVWNAWRSKHAIQSSSRHEHNTIQ